MRLNKLVCAVEDTGIWEEGEFLVPNPVLKFIHPSKNKS